MTDTNVYTFNLSLDDFDLSLLPPHVRDRKSPDFGHEVNKYLQSEFEGFVGTADIVVREKDITVTWWPGEGVSDPVDIAIGLLEKKQYSPGILLLTLLLSKDPDNPSILYNLGMALSDTGKLEKAERYLRRLTEIQPEFVNAQIALGVALFRQKRFAEAFSELRDAVRIDPDNPYALRNLGACFLQRAEFDEAKKHLGKAVELNPNDQNSLFGLAQALEALGELQSADATYQKLLKIAPYSEIAEMARTARTQLAYKGFRDKHQEDIRPDAVTYCLAALNEVETIPKAQLQTIAFEIAMLGRTGFDVADPTPKYRLHSKSGQFSGLQLLCYMYVAFKFIAPEQDIGFDLSREFEAAQRMHGATD